jgi:predicted metal-dependent phosphoesterase TrpH
LPPGEVIRAAHRAGIRLVALSDHDTVAGVEEALLAGEELGVRVVPATEISAVHAEHEDLHVLGYALDHRDATLGERLADAREDRERRAEAMAARLGDLGWAVDDAPLEARRVEGSPIGRPHLAEAVLMHPDNAARIAEEGVGDVSAFIPAYLIPGAPAYVARSRPTVAEAIGWIHDAGGLAVWAHPFWDESDPAAVRTALRAFAAEGIDGVEAFYATHDEAHTRVLVEQAKELGLITTGSADFHGPEHRLFSRFGAFELYGFEPDLGPLAG